MSPDDVLALCRSVPAWSGRHITLRALDGGITNRNFVATVDGQEAVVRVPGERTELLGINRANEAEAAGRAAALGISPQIIDRLPEIGTLITELVAGQHLPTDEFAERVEDVVELLVAFHGSGPLGGRFPIHRVVEWHERDARRHGVEPPPVVTELMRASHRIESAFAQAPLPAVPCHNDLLPANVLFGDDRTWLLDFEYAGMNDRFFDLGNLSVNSSFDRSTDLQLLGGYFGVVTEGHVARLELMKVMSEFREGMWAVVQQAISMLDTDFASYADERLSNCARLVGSHHFDRWLDHAAKPLATIS